LRLFAAGTRIVVTHGTDTMVATARCLAADVRGKTIVLTGAMVPYRFGSSDGLFNLGSALASAQTLPEGVYVAMNGRCFPWNNVVKNSHLGIFEPRRAVHRSPRNPWKAKSVVIRSSSWHGGFSGPGAFAGFYERGAITGNSMTQQNVMQKNT